MTQSSDMILLDAMPAPQRLALTYAPPRARAPWLALLALDARLALLVRGARDPLLGQIKLAWWRERLAEDAGRWPAGEPVLAALRAWNGGHTALVAMVDGWEELLGDAALPEAAITRHAAGRAASLTALATVLGHSAHEKAVRAMGEEWALADFAAHAADPAHRDRAQTLALSGPWQSARLPRDLRPLAVLHALARRSLQDSRGPLIDLAVAMRVGLLGR